MSKPLKVIYAGIFLNKESTAYLTGYVNGLVGHLYDNLLCHHLTLRFKPDEQFLRQIEKVMGATVEMTICSIGDNTRIQAVGIEKEGMVMFSSNDIPHITVSHKDGTKPVESNELTFRPTRSEHPLIGHIAVMTNRGIRYDLKEIL